MYDNVISIERCIIHALLVKSLCFLQHDGLVQSKPSVSLRHTPAERVGDADIDRAALLARGHINAPGHAATLEHRAEKWMPVFGKNDAKTKS
jgi:hypothetical protein